MPHTSSTLIIGIGNEFRGDDRAGLAIVRKLKTRNLTGVCLRETARDGTDIIQLWQEFDNVIVVDAVRSSMPPGFIHRIDLGETDLPDNWHTQSSHLFSLLEAVKLSRVLKTLPTKLILFGIEAATFETGVEMSAPVRHAVERAVTLIEKELARSVPVGGKVKSSR
jgi:hydrogenase maturation protease